MHHSGTGSTFAHVSKRMSDNEVRRFLSSGNRTGKLATFDLAISVAEVNDGGSLGDAQHHAPYAYVGPWQPDAVTGEFWNTSFGAIRSHADCPSADAMVEFFETGRQLVNESGAG